MKTVPVLVAFLGCQMGCAYVAPPPSIQPDAPNVVSLAPQNWYAYYSAGVPPNPSSDNEGAWSFDFPALQTGGHVNYLQTPFSLTTSPQNVTVTFRVESYEPQYEVVDPKDILPATLHLFFEQKDDDLVNPNGRWWAQSGGYDLGSRDNETVTLTVPLTADQWTNVDGQYDAQGFASALENIGWIGVTYGGQYFWGHGVALAGGDSKFILINYVVD
jgi:hypothetical protein